MTRVAALDLGTNTFLCLLAEGENGRLLKIRKDLIEIVRLGQDVQKTGLLHEEALVRAESCLARFSEEIKKFKAEKILAVATSAARDAKNGQRLFDIGRKFGIPIEVIEGEEEANISFSGAIFGIPETEKPVLVIDIGGGSTELIVGQSKPKPKVLFAKSTDIGGVRLTEQIVTRQPVALTEQEKMKNRISTELVNSLYEVKKFNVNKAVAVAGTPTTLAALELGGFDEDKVDGYFLSIETIKKWQVIFAETDVLEKEKRYNIGKRADIIYAGTSILLSILENLNLDGVWVSTKGVRYGLAIKLFGQ